MAVKVYLETYGCTLNQSDSDIIRGMLSACGHEFSSIESSADIIVLNTCTVKAATESKIIERIKKFVKLKKKLVITGCMAVNEKLLRKFAPRAVIIGPSALCHITDAINDAFAGHATTYLSRDDKQTALRYFDLPIMHIPIGEGCISSCHFCQTKLARPFFFSYTPKTILRWIESGLKNCKGTIEFQLTAMDTGVYGMDIGTDLVELLRQICNCNTEKEFYVRLGMINPQHAKRLGVRLINALIHKKMYKFLHIPVQTGSEKVCKEMNRQHTVQDFIDVVNRARENIPDIAISTDIIVGYPTETEEDFQKTVELIETIKPDIINLSKFSPREGTVAKAMKQLPTQIIKRRCTKLAKIVKQIEAEKNQPCIGKTYRVVITEINKRQKDFVGRNEFYKQIVIKQFKGKLGDIVTVNVKSANICALFGEVVDL